MSLLIFIAWYLIGVSSFLFWWTREMPLSACDPATFFIVGFTGPIAWIMGWSIHSKNSHINFFGRKIK
jgi:hypothetical protein